MKRIGLLLVFALLLPLQGNADTLGVWIGANYWDYDMSGTARYKSKFRSDDVDVNDDLGFDSDTLVFGYIVFEHPLPFLPNIKISKTNIDTDASSTLTREFTFGDKTFTANENVSSQLKLDQTDVILYYRILDNVVNLDLGINGKYLDMDARITGEVSGTESAELSSWVPLVYAGVGVDLPLTGLGVNVEASYVGYQDSKFFDFSARVTYDTPWFLGVEAGYRKLKFDLDDFDDITADVEFKGPYLGAYLHF